MSFFDTIKDAASQAGAAGVRDFFSNGLPSIIDAQLGQDGIDIKDPSAASGVTPEGGTWSPVGSGPGSLIPGGSTTVWIFAGGALVLLAVIALRR
jgi:hypothetical protein